LTRAGRAVVLPLLLLAGTGCGPRPTAEPVPLVASLTPETLPLDPGGDSTLTVTLDRVAPAGAVVQLFSSNSGVAVVPGEVTVPAGASMATFDVHAVQDGLGVVTAALNGSAAAASVIVGAGAPPPPADAAPGTDAAPFDSGVPAGSDSGGSDAGDAGSC
jgi:hypothetical protein